jgi:hypothetical protein
LPGFQLVELVELVELLEVVELAELLDALGVWSSPSAVASDVSAVLILAASVSRLRVAVSAPWALCLVAALEIVDRSPLRAWKPATMVVIRFAYLDGAVTAASWLDCCPARVARPLNSLAS